MNCEACVLAWLGCPIGMMSSAIAFREFPFLVIGIIVGAGIIFGRFLCGWVCPMGFLQDLLYKIPGPKFRILRFLTWFKYGFLLITVVAVSYFIGKESLLFFCSFCPTATLQVVIPTMISDHDFALDAGRILRFSVLVIVLGLVIGNRRSFCKIMCPIGALVVLTNKFSLFSIRFDANKCVKCGKCDRDCPMDIPVMNSLKKDRAVNRNVECIECLTCEEICPTKAIANNSKILHAS